MDEMKGNMEVIASFEIPFDFIVKTKRVDEGAVGFIGS